MITPLGYLDGGMEAWINAGKKTDQITSVSANEFEQHIQKTNHRHVLDVRKDGEYRLACI